MLQERHNTKEKGFPTDQSLEAFNQKPTTKKVNDMSSLALNFNSVQFDIVDALGQVWLKATQIGVALGYADDKAVQRLYARNADEFTGNMTTVVKLTTVTGDKETRIFSLRGCHLLAMFARTAIAKEFRKWVLDILDTVASVKLTDSPTNPHLALRDTIANTAKGNRQLYKSLYSRLYRQFQVTSYKEIPVEQCVAAIDFIKSVEGEYIGRDKITAPKPNLALCDGQHYVVAKDGVVLMHKVLSHDINDSCLKTMGINQDKFESLKKDLAHFCANEDPRLEITYPTAQRTLSMLSAVLVTLERNGLNMALMYQKTNFVSSFLTNYYSRLEAIHFQMCGISKNMSLDAINYASDICRHPTVVSCHGIKIA